MDITEIIKGAWQIVKKERATWQLGLLTYLISGLFGMLSFHFTPQTNGHQPWLRDLDWSKSHPELGLAIGSAFLIIFIILYYISLVSQGALILSIEEKETGEGNHFNTARLSYKKGRLYAARLAGTDILINGSLLIITALLSLPLIVMYVRYSHTISPSVALATLAALAVFLLCIPLYIYGFLLNMVAKRFVVVQKKPVAVALRCAFKLMRKQFANLFQAGLVSFFIEGSTSIAIAILIWLSVLFALITGTFVYYILHTPGAVAYGIVIGLGLLMLILLIVSLKKAYFSAYWTMVFLATDYLSKQA